MARKIEPEVSSYMRRMGRRGGKARLTTMTAEERSEIARKGGKAGGRGRPRVEK